MVKVLQNNIALQKIFRVESARETRLDKLRLDKNERANDHNKKILNKIKNFITSDLISAYPEFYNLYKKLSNKLKVKKENIILTSGSDQALKNCFEVYYKKNSHIITLDPTFAMIDIYCKIFQTLQIKIGYDKKLRLDLEKLLKSITYKTSLIIIANPNSPTGTILEFEDIKKIILKAKKNKATVIIDEAYFEFSKYNCINLIKSCENLVIIRTFSKLFGFAGLRIGYVVSNKKNIKKFKALKPMYEANSIAIKAVETALDNSQFFYQYLKEMRLAEKYAINFCYKNKIRFIKTYANFFHIDLGLNKNKIIKKLKKNKILVKGDLSVNGFENYLRISLANYKSIKKTLSIIKQSN